MHRRISESRRRPTNAHTFKRSKAGLYTSMGCRKIPRLREDWTLPSWETMSVDTFTSSMFEPSLHDDAPLNHKTAFDVLYEREHNLDGPTTDSESSYQPEVRVPSWARGAAHGHVRAGQSRRVGAVPETQGGE